MNVDKDHLLRLTELYVAQRDRTKDTQWKVNIGLWTLLTAAIYVGLVTEHPERAPRDQLWLMYLLPAIHGLWAVQVSRSLEGDRALIHEWRAQVEGKELKREAPVLRHYRCAIWLFIQVGVTLVLTYAASEILGAS